MSDIAFVRAEAIPPAPPPVSETGAIKWMRENLFSSISNGVLSFLSLAVVLWIVWSLLPWFTGSVWNAGSLSECRALGEGACFAVIRERFNQFIFGFYPPDWYWRPILTFLLLVAALAPVLFSLPRQLLLLTVAFPALAYFLLWGGSVWYPVMAMAGFGVGFAVWRYGGAVLGPLGALIAGVLAAVIWWMFLSSPVAGAFASVLPLALPSVESAQMGGFMLTLIIGITGIAGSLPLGIILALGRQSKLFIVKAICVGFIEFIRGVPLITLLFVASTLLNYFLPPGTEFALLLRVLILVIFFASAYMAETIRGGLAALPKGQYEAADALGLDYWRATRLIVMPQALKISIPGIVNNFIGLFKDTTLVSVIGLLDPLGVVRPIRANSDWNGIVWELYGFVALLFFICCFGMSRYSMYLERKMRTDHR